MSLCVGVLLCCGPQGSTAPVDPNRIFKILSHPGHGNQKSLNKGNWTSFWTLQTFHLSSERLFSAESDGGECQLISREGGYSHILDSAVHLHRKEKGR